MPTLKFIGHIHSPGIEASFDAIPSIIWTIADTGKQWHFKTTIIRSAIEVTCDLDEYLPAQFGAIHARAHDLGSFATGTPVTLLFDEVIYPSGERHRLWIAERDLAELCTVYRLGAVDLKQQQQFGAVMNMILSDYALAKAINDLTQTLHSQTQTAINCGRVLDGLRKLEAPSEDKAIGWTKLQSLLNADKNYLNYITQKSVEPRHGDRSIPPIDEGNEIQFRTWGIMNRYLEYRIRGRQPLPLSEFPLLRG